MIGNMVEYVGKDLEAMNFAVKYHAWILDLIKPFLGRRLVEVGAGTGAFSEMLLKTSPELLALVEPSSMFKSLRPIDGGLATNTKVCLYNDVFANIASDIRRKHAPDTVLYINVMEHIENDAEEFKLIHEILPLNGRAIIFVPALPLLFSEFDKQIGHYRRYRRAELKVKCKAAGLNILMLRWFDMAGILPWLIKYRLFGSLKMPSSAVNAYDRLAVPIVRPLETILRPPVGKNLLLVAERR